MARSGVNGPGGFGYGGMLMRALGIGAGEAGEYLGGIQRRGVGDSKAAFKELEKTYAAAVTTGLEHARIPELLEAQNALAEDAYRLAPSRGDQTGQMRSLLYLLQGQGIKGRYAGAVAQRLHAGIAGAEGAQQAFMLRAFGFGTGGASLQEAYQRMELGAGQKGNVSDVIGRLFTEYGKGKGGGLSFGGLLAGKSLFGLTTHNMASVAQAFQEGGEEKALVELQKIEKESEKGGRLQSEMAAAMGRAGGKLEDIARWETDLVKLGGTLRNMDHTIQGIFELINSVVDPIITIFGGGKASKLPAETPGGNYRRYYDLYPPEDIEDRMQPFRRRGRRIHSVPVNSFGDVDIVDLFNSYSRAKKDEQLLLTQPLDKSYDLLRTFYGKAGIPSSEYSTLTPEDKRIHSRRAIEYGKTMEAERIRFVADMGDLIEREAKERRMTTDVFLKQLFLAAPTVDFLQETVIKAASLRKTQK